jgi:hypothetical protein
MKHRSTEFYADSSLDMQSPPPGQVDLLPDQIGRTERGRTKPFC